jgi:hypothetical protein
VHGFADFQTTEILVADETGSAVRYLWEGGSDSVLVFEALGRQTREIKEKKGVKKALERITELQAGAGKQSGRDTAFEEVTGPIAQSSWGSVLGVGVLEGGMLRAK